jgi:putative FmdB family regulatory protein
MPIYEYKCSKCSETFEVLQRFSDQPLAVHESCGGSVERLLSPPGLQFKGSGWYITDYARGGKGKNGDSKKAEPATAAAKTESSPAASPAGTSAPAASKT